MRVYRLTLEITEPTGPTPSLPIVVHVFQGRTREEAVRYFRAHMTTDEFFRGAVMRSRWEDLPLGTRFSEGWVDL